MYFGIPDDNLPLSKKIKECCESGHSFNVLLCKENNSELEKRYEKNDPIFGYITHSITNINNIIRNGCLNHYQYEFSPYATIVFLNEHIYYTPHVLYSSADEHLSNKITEVTLCVDRESPFGIKLEKQFDELWKKEESKCSITTEQQILS